MPIWQLCANLLIPNCLRSNLSYAPLAALELYVNNYICQIEEVKTNKDFPTVEDFLAYTNFYSIFDSEELKQWYQQKNCYILKMTYNIALTKRVTNGYLVDNLNMSPKYWGFFQLTDEQFDAILKKGEVDEGVIID